MAPGEIVGWAFVLENTSDKAVTLKLADSNGRGDPPAVAYAAGRTVRLVPGRRDEHAANSFSLPIGPHATARVPGPALRIESASPAAGAHPSDARTNERFPAFREAPGRYTVTASLPYTVEGEEGSAVQTTGAAPLTIVDRPTRPEE